MNTNLGGVIPCTYSEMPQVQAKIYFTLMTIWIFHKAVFYFWKVFVGKVVVFVFSEIIEDILEFLTSNKAWFFTKNKVNLQVEDKVVVAAYFERTSSGGLKY